MSQLHDTRNVRFPCVMRISLECHSTAQLPHVKLAVDNLCQVGNVFRELYSG